SALRGILFAVLSKRGDLGREPQPHDGQGLTAIRVHDQQVGAIKPFVEFAESVAATFDFETQVAAEQRNGNVATKTTARGATQGHTLGGKAAFLQQAHDSALSPIALLSRCTSAAHGPSPSTRSTSSRWTRSRSSLNRRRSASACASASKSSKSRRGMPAKRRS